MINRKENESRLAYLLRVAIRHISDHASDCLTEYDGTDCDGSCLADELQQELEDLDEKEARQSRIVAALNLKGPALLRAQFADSIAPPLEAGEHWPLPWRNPAEDGTFGTILAANGEPVAQVQSLLVEFEPDIRKRNDWRNLQARRICEAVNATAAADFMAEHMPEPEVEEIPLELCPQCHRHLNTEKHPMTRGHRVECRHCNIHALGDTVELACLRLHAAFGPKPFSAPCPRCTYPITEKAFKSSEFPALTVEITCPYCNLQAMGETRDEALGFMATNAKLAPNGYDKKPAPAPEYRLLQDGETTSIIAGDEFQVEPGKWEKTQREGRRVHDGLVGAYRRPVNAGPGWHILKVGEPLKPGDGFIHPDNPPELGFIDYACRPQLFRDEEGGKATAHRWTWRRRNP